MHLATYNNAETRRPCKLALADGTVVTGEAVGYHGETGGELCFNTGVTGYQEVASDPSYHGQIMMMTYPHIGNYGATDADMESKRPMIAGLVVRSFSRRYSNPGADSSLEQLMLDNKLVGISGVDTRALVLHIRKKGVMNAVISAVDLDDDSLIAKAQNWPSMEGLNLAHKVSTRQAYDFCDGSTRIAVFDFGVKQHLLRSFQSRNCAVRVFPADAPLGEVMAWNPDGIFFSNGPGDPRAMSDTIGMVKDAIETQTPMFGICLGHQLMGLAAGLDVYKMHVGHRGANHPVKNLRTSRVEVTTQNHGFGIEGESVRDDVAEVSHVNLNDGTVEGLRFKRFNGMSVQYHPEASPGPHDSRYLFDEFLGMIANRHPKNIVAS